MSWAWAHTLHGRCWLSPILLHDGCSWVFFLPLDEVEEGMEHLKAVMPQDPPEVEALLSLRTLIVHASVVLSDRFRIQFRLRRIPPMFTPVPRSVHDATTNNNPLTNNLREGCNVSFAKKFTFCRHT